MDIAKYIGLYLIKSEYCYLPGIGSFRVVRKPAQYEDGNLLPPEHTVEFQYGVGSIDDTFANFIATNEGISIANAANKLKEYSKETKDKLFAGEEMIVPSIGKLYTKGGHEVLFEIDPHLNIKGKVIPNFKINPQIQEQKDSLSEIIQNTEIKEPKPGEEIVIKPPTVNWGKIIILGLLVLVLTGGLIYFLINFSQNKPDKKEPVAPVTTIIEEEGAADTVPEEQQSTVTPALQDDSLMISINKYTDLAKATSRMKTLRTNNNNAIVWTKDSTEYHVAIKIANQADTQKAKDSLRLFFNPNGKVEIIKP